MPSTAAHAGRQQRTARGKRARRAGIDHQRTEWRQRTGDPAFAGGAAFRRGEEPGAARALLQRGERTLGVAVGDRHGAAGLRGDARRRQLGAHAAGGIAGRRLATHRLDLRRDGGHDRDVRGGGVAPWIGGVEAVDVGQQHQLVGLHHLGDARGEAVVVAEADLRGRHGVVLVDHRDAAEAEQGVQCGARVEVAAAILGVVQRQQQLRGGQALGGQRLAPGLRQADLADRGGGLLFLQPEAALVQAERTPRQRDGAGGDHDHVDAARAQRGDVGGHAIEPGGAGRGLVRVDHQRAADLHHQALGGGEGGDHYAIASPSPCGGGGSGPNAGRPLPQRPPARGGGELSLSPDLSRRLLPPGRR